MQIKVMQVGQLGTNCYLLEDEETRTAAVVDPGGEGARILAQLKADGMELKLILLTTPTSTTPAAWPSCAPPCLGCRCISTRPTRPWWGATCSPPSARRRRPIRTGTW